MCSIHHIPHDVQYPSYSIRCVVFITFHTMYSIHHIPHDVQYPSYSTRCVVFFTFHTMCSIHHIPHDVQYPSYSTRCVVSITFHMMCSIHHIPLDVERGMWGQHLTTFPVSHGLLGNSSLQQSTLCLTPNMEAKATSTILPLLCCTRCIGNIGVIVQDETEDRNMLGIHDTNCL